MAEDTFKCFECGCEESVSTNDIDRACARCNPQLFAPFKTCDEIGYEEYLEERGR